MCFCKFRSYERSELEVHYFETYFWKLFMAWLFYDFKQRLRRRVWEKIFFPFVPSFLIIKQTSQIDRLHISRVDSWKLNKYYRRRRHRSFVAIWVRLKRNNLIFYVHWYYIAYTNWKYSGEWPTQTASPSRCLGTKHSFSLRKGIIGEGYEVVRARGN